MKKLLLIILITVSSHAFADVYTGFSGTASTNPCEYVNTVANNANKLDVGDDPNFERIKQQNNRTMIRECQDLVIQQLRTAQRDTY
jgi:hypothetical protein